MKATESDGRVVIKRDEIMDVRVLQIRSKYRVKLAPVQPLVFEVANHLVDEADIFLSDSSNADVHTQYSAALTIAACPGHKKRDRSPLL